MRLVLMVLLAIVASVASAQGEARCFVKGYPMQLLNGSDTHYVTTIDTLAPVPLMLNFDSISLSGVLVDGCANTAKYDPLRFLWTNDPNYTAPFAVFPLKCGSQKPTFFAISTLAARQWGSSSRSVTDGREFGVQFSETSMLTAMHAEHNAPRRLRPLMMTMHSTRVMMSDLLVRVCIRATDVPYDMPEGMVEVAPPDILPIVSCVTSPGDRCGVDIGYINSGPAQLTLKYPSSLNKLIPASMENGFHMLSTFETGVHEPDSFWPPIRLAWVCEDYISPEDAVWKINGHTLRLNKLDFTCSTLNVVDANGLVVLDEDAKETKKIMRQFQDTDPWIDITLKDQIVEPRIYHVDQHLAERSWAEAGVTRTHMSTIGRDTLEKNLAQAVANAGAYHRKRAIHHQIKAYDDSAHYMRYRMRGTRSRWN